MNKAIVTGMNGTVAPVLARVLQKNNVQVVPWDRKNISPDDLEAVANFIRAEKPDALFHLAGGNPAWAEKMAEVCFQERIKFLFTSTVSVFADGVREPLEVDAVPDATDDYGRYKIECERRILSVNPDSVIARLGWQIGDEPGSNNMVDYMHKQVLEKGHIEASVNWFPSCSFLEDTAEALYALMRKEGRGIYHLNGNPGLSLFQIMSLLIKKQGRSWNVVCTEEPRRRNMMVDARIQIGKISDSIQ